ncbi:hypothetical protein I6U48_22325 [Clostridium sp. PL3]|uniref:Uncharacterized protein n=1 Tax=Clostridium thailandense TaxID=2794346 RepID=A0A949U3C8_9CLOT|nr:hypothetical protein [Clostridium thailandense]MBV7275639.1 hypothetical protein [Clostridium thailandense]
MIIETERLELILLTANQLKLWTEDISALEKELKCTYKAEPMEDIFLEIVKGQYEIIQKDPNNCLWHSFFFLIRKEDRVVVGSADFENFSSQNILKRCGFKKYKQGETLWWIV